MPVARKIDFDSMIEKIRKMRYYKKNYVPVNERYTRIYRLPDNSIVAAFPRIYSRTWSTFRFDPGIREIRRRAAAWGKK